MATASKHASKLSTPKHIPSPLKGSDGKATFTYVSVITRLPKIVDQIVKAYPLLTPDVAEQFEALKSDIQSNKPLLPLGRKDWDPFLQDSDTWLDAPWFLVENYFYKRILAIICYKSAADDPFASHKQEALEAAESGFVDSLLKMDKGNDLRSTLLNSLWGNQADLSLSAGEVETGEKEKSTDSHILRNDMSDVLQLLSSPPPQEKYLIWVLDNCGKELLSDLVCIDELLRLWEGQEKSSRTLIHIHAKDEPTFVSDAIVEVCGWIFVNHH